MKTIISGIKPSGTLHLGNYLGMIKQCIEMQEKFNSILFIADLHALTSVKNAEELRQNTMNLALDFLALGLNPEKTIFFKQSDLPEHAELGWILNCFTPFGLMERAHAWKDAQEKKQRDLNLGLFNYPVLMAADILLYSPDIVPVGKDQKQHIEIARDIANKFNLITETQTFSEPEEYTPEEIATIIGTDGEKMSKSYQNTIEVFANEATLKKQVMSIKTDSTPLEEPKNHETCNVFQIYKHFGTKDEIADLQSKYEAGNFGFGEAKQILLQKLLDYFGEARKKRIELAGDIGYIENVLKTGAKRAKHLAEAKLQEAKKAIGLIF